MQLKMTKKTHGIWCIIVSLAFLVTAQVNVDEAVDFTLTDVSGTTHHLFEYLEQGKYVVINLTLMG